MRKFYVLLAAIVLMLPFGFAQNRVTFTENFNSTNSSFTRSPQSAWMLDTTLSVGGKAAWGFVPNAEGDSIELISPVYDLSNYAYAYLRFAHICKVSEEDLVTVEYKENYVGSKWVPIPYADYKGASQVYRKQRCFHHGAYTEWVKNDMTAQPDNSWWKVESFDISQDVAYAEVQFKFKIKKGSTVGTNFAWGWFIDNFELMASTAQITPPVVQFVAPFTNGTVYGPGPYTIYAKAAKRTIVPLKQPVLRVSYTALSGKITNDSIMMTPYAGDSMWKATIPQQVIGTKVSYTIYAADTVGNSNMASSGYTIGREWGYDSNCVALLSIDTPLVGAIAGKQTPVEVTIQNRGLSNLTSAIINWSVNGVAQNPVKWTGSLNEGFRTRVSLGTYMPAMNMQDTIVASVSMPNGDKVNNTKDTIASKRVYGCATIPSGKYVVDPDSTNTTPGVYHTINEILDAIRICGSAGDIQISLAKGVYYEEIELVDFSKYMAPGSSLLIESATGKAEDVVFEGSNPGTVRLVVSNTSNLTVRNITFKGIATGVRFGDTVSNAELSGCRVLVDTLTTTTYVGVLIYQGAFDRIRVLNNYIEGAYYSMYIYGNSTSDYAKNITVMGNRMHASYYYGMYTYYVDFDYVSNNVVTNRTKNASNYYYGLRFYYVNADEIANNRVNIAADYTYGIYTYYFNRDSSRTGLVANNEIIMRTNTTAYGAYVYYSTVEYSHNTIISLGNPGTTYGVYYGAVSGYKAHFYNNNFSCYGKSAYPFYMTGVTTVGTDLLMDYNNYYGPQYVGYAGGARSTLKEWITYCQDVNAANVKPAYINSSKDGRCLYYTGMTCPILTNVPNDITGKVRAGSTSMGCYTQNPVQFDAALLDFHDWKSSVTIGKAETVKVRMMNTGTVTNIVSVQLNMSLNGTVLTPSQWKGSLAPFKDTIVTVGTYVPVSGVNNLTAWISNQNGIAAGDSSASNDTIRTYSFGCKAPMSGTYTVGGKGADYADLDQALEMLASCGADAPVVFALDSGTYEPITLSGRYPGVSGKNTVTITSRSGKASDVVFTGGTPVIGFAAGSSHFRIDRITVDGLNSTTGVQITGAVNDVRITHCNIMMSPTTTATHYGINCSSGTIRDSIWIIGNHVDGGYYGIYFYNGNNSAASGHGRWHRIDSNVISNAYYYAVYSYYTDFESFSYNRMTDRSEGGNGYFYGLNSYYCNHRYVVGNRVHSMSTYHTNSYGLYIYYSNYSSYAQNTTDTTYLLDNEALVRGTSYTYGLYCYYGNMQVMHNSVYAICTGSYGYGIYMYNASPYYAQVRNNNIYVKGGTYYPMYCGGTISYFLLSDNNYYHDGNTNLAYMGSARTSLSQVQTYDATATNLMPEYIDPLVDSRVCGNTGFTAKPVTNVYYQKYGYRDILDTLRPNKDVTRGAYEVAKLNNNAHLVSFTEPSVAVVAKGQTVDVKVLLNNRGENTLTSCTIGWDINGVSQPALKWTGSLAKGQSISVKLGSKMIMDSAYLFTAYVSDPNGMKDDLPSDDTARTEIQGCDMQLTGNYRVGNSKSADMTFDRAIQIMEKCGVGGPVTLRIENGTYKTNLDFSKIIGMSNYTPITITSLSGDSSDVVIEAATEAPTVILAGTKNLTLSHITIKGFVGGKTSTAIRMDGANKHLTIRGCHLSTATMSSQAVTDVAISSNQPVSPDTVIVIVGNTITGNGGIYLYGNSSTRSNDVRIDSNTILSPYYYAIYTYYYDIRTINANFIHKYPTESQCNYGIYPLGSYGVLDQVTSISFNRVHGAYSNMLYMTNSYSLGVSGSDISRPILINNNEFICSGSHTGYNFTLWNSGGYLIIAHNTFVIPQGASRTYMISMYTYNPGHFQFFNNNLVNYGNCTNIYYTNWATQNTYMDVWDYNNYWIGNGQFNMNGATTKTVAGFSSILQGGRDANSTMADPRITYPDSIGKPSVWAGLLCASSSYAPTDILGLQRSSMTYKGCYTETFNLDAALLNFVEPKDESVVAGTTTPVKVKLMNVGADTIKSLTIRWSVDGVMQTPVSLTNMNLASYESREVALGSFVPGSNQNIASIVAWCENPNGRLDNNTSTDTITKRLIVCGKALSGNYIIGSSSKADFVSTTEAVSMLNYCGVSGPVVFSIEAGSYPAMELGKIPGSSSTNTVTFVSASGNRDAVVIGEGASPALKMENTSHVTFRNVTIGSATNAANQVAVQFMGYIENVLFHHCNLYVQASTTNSSSHVVDYNNTNNSTNYLKDVRFIGNEVRGGYYGFYLYYAGGNAANCKTSAANRASVRIDSNYIYDQYYYPVYSYYYTYIPSFSHNTIKSRLGASYSYGVYFYYYNLVDSVVGNRLNINVSSYAYGGIRLYYYINYTSTFGSDIVPAVVANNEIISVAGTTAYGIYAYNYVNASIINNSVYCKAPTNYGMYLYTQTTTTDLNVLNNIFVTENGSSANYLVYAGQATALTSYPTTFDYNDYYTTGTNKNNFYVGSARTFANWQSTYNMDGHSVQVDPGFDDPTVDLSISQFSDQLKCNRNRQVMRDINNDARTSLTIMGCYSTPLFEGYDLQVEAYVEPTVGGIQCFPNSTPVKLGIYNMGTYDADFMANPVTLYLKCESDSVNFVKNITINKGGIGIMKRDTLEVVSNMDITYAGMYKLTAWLEWTKDQQRSDDTLKLDYYVDKTVLPYDNNFTGQFAGVATNQAYGDITWEVVNSNPVLNPVYGTGSLLFRSSEARGSISQALFTSVSLQGTYNPHLYFWYAHDNKNPYLRDQMEVRISQDGGATFKTLQTLYRYDAKCTQPTWREYKMDLSKYSTGSCIIIAFTAYSYGGGDQTVDRVKIVAQQDMRVLVEVPSDTDFAACNLTGRSLKVYLENLTSQEVPFNAGDSVTVEMSGASNFIFKQALTGRLENRELDSLILSPIDYVGGGQFDVKVYVNAIDSNAANDTAKFSLNLNPDLSVTGYDAIGFTAPGDTVYVGFTMKNTGNLEIVSPFNVKVVVNGVDTITELVTASLKPGDTLYYKFRQGVIVPMTTADQPYYLLDVYAVLPCDANGDNDSVRIIGNVNIVDNGILSITNPVNGQCAMGGEMAKVEVRLFNNGNVDNTDSVIVTAVIDSAGAVYATLTEKVAPMYGGENRNYTFSQQYRVPRLSVNGAQASYNVKVFLTALDGDVDLSSDTAKVEACVQGGVGVESIDADRWMVGQNVPNPAAELTRIPYVIPEAGVLTLRIMGMNGQVLYREDVNAEAGSGDIRVNLSDLAAGVYYYSVEYRGERIVKKMNVTR